MYRRQAITWSRSAPSSSVAGETDVGADVIVPGLVGDIVGDIVAYPETMAAASRRNRLASGRVRSIVLYHIDL